VSFAAVELRRPIHERQEAGSTRAAARQASNSNAPPGVTFHSSLDLPGRRSSGWRPYDEIRSRKERTRELVELLKPTVQIHVRDTHPFELEVRSGCVQADMTTHRRLAPTNPVVHVLDSIANVVNALA
jgi:hypothetical protein